MGMCSERADLSPSHGVVPVRTRIRSAPKHWMVTRFCFSWLTCSLSYSRVVTADPTSHLPDESLLRGDADVHTDSRCVHAASLVRTTVSGCHSALRSFSLVNSADRSTVPSHSSAARPAWGAYAAWSALVYA